MRSQLVVATWKPRSLLLLLLCKGCIISNLVRCYIVTGTNWQENNTFDDDWILATTCKEWQLTSIGVVTPMYCDANKICTDSPLAQCQHPSITLCITKKLKQMPLLKRNSEKDVLQRTELVVLIPHNGIIALSQTPELYITYVSLPWLG